MTKCAIHLLGKFQITHNSQPLTTLSFPRAQSLLAYLALHRREPQARQQLAFRFWPDSSETQARTNLRKQLLYLRQTLPDAASFLRMDRHTVQLDPAAAIQVDVTAFKAALAHAAQATGDAALAALREAVALYTGDLLPGCYDEWLLAEREALRETYFSALERVTTLLEARRDYGEAIAYAQQLLRHDPLNEPAYRRLMRLHALNEDRAAALRVYHACITQLRTELDVPPHPDTHALYEQLLRHAEPAAAVPQALNVDAPFVGRQAEWQELQQAWQRAMRGQPNLVLITGEAGIGKSRLAQEFQTWATHQGILTAHTRAYAAEGRLPYAPVITWLRTGMLKEQWSTLTPTWLTEVARLLPEIVAERPQVAAPLPLTDDGQRHRLFEALARAILAGGKPLLLVLDDLQWSERETLEWLHFLLRFANSLATHPTPGKSPNSPRFLVVGTVRTEEVLADHPLTTLQRELARETQLTSMPLSPLTATETNALVNQMLATTLNKERAAQLYRETEGHPLFVVETIRAHFAAQRAEPAPAAKQHPSLALQATHLPPKMQTLIEARLAQLSPPARKVAELAAVIGREFTVSVLAHAIREDEDHLVEALDELWQRRIIREQGSGGYDFSHDKLREIAYHGLSQLRRRLLHRRVAQALINAYAHDVEPVAAQLAAHYEQVNDYASAQIYYRQAGEAALRIFANHEAIGHFQKAIACLLLLPVSFERDQTEIALQMLLMPPLMTTKHYSAPEAISAYQRAYLLCLRLNQAPAPAILGGLANTAIMHGEYHTSVQRAQEMLATTPNSGDSVTLIQGHYLLGVSYFWLGDFTQSEQHLAKVLALYDAQERMAYIVRYVQDPKAVCLQRLGYTLWQLGYPRRAYATIEAAFAYLETQAHPFTLGYVFTFSLMCHIDSRDLVGAQTLLVRATAFLHDHEFPHWQSMIDILAGWLQVVAGQTEAGLAQMCAAYALFYERGNRIALPFFQSLVAQAYAAVGDYRMATNWLADALQSVERQDERWCEAELYLLQGEFALQAAAEQVTATILSEAIAYFQKALTIARSQQAKSLELRASVSLARLWQQQGKRREAQQLLAEIYGWFTEGFATPDLLDAQALLAELSES